MDTTNIFELSTGIEQVDTTTGQNGYPRHLRVAYTADTMGELRALKEAAEAAGHDVSVIQLHRRDGWALWERSNDYDLDDDRWTGTNNGDWTIAIEPGSEREDEAFNAVCGEGYEIEDAADLFRRAQQVRALADALPDPNDLKEGEKIVCFIDTNDWNIDYTVRTGQNGYSYDTHQHKSALLIVEHEREDDIDQAS